MKITIITVGKIKEKYLKDAIAEYTKRLSKYCKLEIVEVADEKTPDNASEVVEDSIRSKEAERILKYVKDDAFVITLEINGKQLTSEELAKKIDTLGIQGHSHIIFIIGGAAAIAVGGDLVVDSASRIATTFGMSQTLVGLTIVSIGTSLPELVTSIVAARKKEVDMALGNAIGSNIFNILMVLGIASAISPIAFITENIIDIAILLIFSIVIWIFAWSRKKINRTEGIIMLLLYAAYAVYIVIRG